MLDDRWERWHLHDADGSGWVLMMFFMVMIVVAVGVLVAVLVRQTGTAARPSAPVTPPVSSEAQGILRRRFAAGEIDEEEFRRRSAALMDIH